MILLLENSPFCLVYNSDLYYQCINYSNLLDYTKGDMTIAHHKFQIGDLVIVKKHSKEKLKLTWEPGYRIIDFPIKWSARVRIKESGEPLCCNAKDVKLKDHTED